MGSQDGDRLSSEEPMMNWGQLKDSRQWFLSFDLLIRGKLGLLELFGSYVVYSNGLQREPRMKPVNLVEPRDDIFSIRLLVLATLCRWRSLTHLHQYKHPGMLVGSSPLLSHWQLTPEPESIAASPASDPSKGQASS
jgi:hypothetical protein